jgi:L-fucose mutarotase
MEVIGSGGARNEVQDDVLAVACDAAGRQVSMGGLERFAFYERAKRCFAVVQTTEDRPFGCFILSKGVLPDFTP